MGEGDFELLLSRLLLSVAERLSISAAFVLLPALAEEGSAPASFSAAMLSDKSVSGGSFMGGGSSERRLLKGYEGQQ